MIRLTALLLTTLAVFAADSRTESVVAADGSGQFRTVQAAVDAAPSNSRSRFVIRIRPGIYQERVTVPPEKTFLTLAGEDRLKTVITAGVHAGMPGPNGRPLITFGTPTVFIQANDFIAENITFENSAGAQGQALALTIMSDRGVFRNCRFLGYQDTLLAQAGRQYFEHCYIEGAVDFIFGGSTAWFEDCEIHVKANGYITAANTPKDQRYGYIFSHCRITGEPDVRTYLGRPWRPYAATVFLNTEMSDAVRPEGWNNWNDPTRERTVRYAEFGSTGPGNRPVERVPWARRLTEAEAHEYSIEGILGGIDGWNPKTGETRWAPVTTTKAPAKPAAIPAGMVWLATAAGDPKEGLHLAYTTNGLKWTAIARPLLAPSVGQKEMRDPRMIQGPNGQFHLVWASGTRGDTGFGYASSRDLSEWPDERYEDIMKDQNALDLASPNLFYDEVSRRFVVTWASTIARNFIQSFQEEVENNPRIWYATTRDFNDFSAPELFFDPNYSVRDGVILDLGGHVVLLHNDNTRPMLDLRMASASTPFGPWGPSGDTFTAKFTESPAAIQLGREWWIYFFNTQTGTVGLTRTRDFRTFTEAAEPVEFPPGLRPTSILQVRRSVVERLAR